MTKRKFWLAIAATALVVLVPWLLAGFTTESEYCAKNKLTGAKECATYYSAFVFWFHFTKILQDYNGAITAVATLAIVWYTAVSAGATRSMQDLAAQQRETDRIHERAYIFGGGPYGVPKPGILADKITYSPEPSDFDGPWQMTIQNYGRTPGYVVGIKWGLWPSLGAFKALDDSVTAIIRKLESGELTLPKDAEFYVSSNVDDSFPPREKPIRHRHVEFKQDRAAYLGFVFFGRIDYRDVFNDRHHSTFKLLLLAKNSDPLPGSYSDDKS